MRKTKLLRSLSLALVFCLFLAVFSACDESNTDSPENTSTETETVTEPETEIRSETEPESITETDTETVTETETETEKATETETVTETVTVPETETETETETVTETETETETETDTETESETETDTEAEEPNKNSASVGIYDSYDLDTYMRPIWDGNIVHNETVMFVGNDDKAPLLYTPDRVISVRSYDLSIEYIEGVDYALENGKLVLLPGTRIPVCPLETYYSVLNGKPYLSTMYNGQVTQTMYGEGDTMCRWQVAVTYKHSGTWGGVDVKSYSDRFAGFIEKLESGEDVTVFFYGDSITTGANASGTIGVAPYSPSWAVMFCQFVAKQYGYTVKYVDSYSDSSLTEGKPAGGTAKQDTVYGTNGTITYVNTAVGGWSTEQGLTNFDAYVKAYMENYGCDLFVLAFGMNNGGSTASNVCELLEDIVGRVTVEAPDSDILLVSTMIPNPEAVRNSADTYFCNGNQPTFEAEMIPLAENINSSGTDCALAPMTSISSYIHSQKRYRDTTGNNVNHPSDFIVRVYAQSLFETVFGYDSLPDNTNALEGAPVADANYNALCGNIYLDGSTGTDNANFAACVRLESANGGYYMYHIAELVKVYINATSNGELEYSTAPSTVWTYNETDNVMECADAEELKIMLTAPEICLHPVVSGNETHGRISCVRCGIAGADEEHTFFEEALSADGKTTYTNKCRICGVTLKTYTVDESIIYYSAYDTYNAHQYFMLDKTFKSENGYLFTRVTPETYVGHELHWVNQNDTNHYDSNGNKLNTNGVKYLVLKLRVSGSVSLSFKYKITDGENCTISLVNNADKTNKWLTYVIDLEAASAGKYKDYGKGFQMDTFKLFFGSDFDSLENGYVDIGYLALCSDFDEISKIADTDTVHLITTAGLPVEVSTLGECLTEHSITETVSGDVYSFACEICGKDFGSRTVPEGTNMFISAFKADSAANASSRINYAEIINDGDGTYSRIYGGSGKNYNEMSLYSNSSGSLATGQYLVIKYRVGENGRGQTFIKLYAGTKNSYPSSETEAITLYGTGSNVEDGLWHTAIIDMSTMTNGGFTEGADGKYYAKFVALRPFYISTTTPDTADDYMDIAYVAVCDSLEKAEALVDDGTYEYYTDRSTGVPEVKTITQ